LANKILFFLFPFFSTRKLFNAMSAAQKRVQAIKQQLTPEQEYANAVE
jgi:hypothetical protein